MDDLQYDATTKEGEWLYKVLNLIINGWPSIHTSVDDLAPTNTWF